MPIASNSYFNSISNFIINNMKIFLTKNAVLMYSSLASVHAQMSYLETYLHFADHFFGILKQLHSSSGWRHDKTLNFPKHFSLAKEVNL